MNRATRFAVALSTLLVAHNVADHIAQTDHQAAHKATSAGALGLVAAATGTRFGWPGLLAGLAFSAGTHALIDRRWPVAWVLRKTGSPKFAEMQAPICGPYQADQALHHGCLLVAALMMVGKR